MKATIDPARAISHMRILSLSLPEIMRITKQSGQVPGCVCLLIGQTQGLARWLSPESLSDPPLAAMAARTKGSMESICVVIAEPDGARTGYLLSALVSWTEYKAGFAIFEEHYIPGDTVLTTPVATVPDGPVQEDVFETI